MLNISAVLMVLVATADDAPKPTETAPKSQPAAEEVAAERRVASLGVRINGLYFVSDQTPNNGFEPTRRRFVALCDIEQGEELTENYGLGNCPW